MNQAAQNEEDLERIEISLENAKKRVHLRDALIALTGNIAFKEIIQEGYFVNEASRLVLLKADPSMQDDESQTQIDNSILGVSYLRLYLHTIMRMGDTAEKAITDDEETREEILAEAH
jgi:hypothetical protein